MIIDDYNTHSIEIKLKGNYPSGLEEQVKLKVLGDGSIQYFMDTFKAFMISAGFSSDVVEQIAICEEKIKKVI